MKKRYTGRALMGEQQWQYEQGRTVHGGLGAFRGADKLSTKMADTIMRQNLERARMFQVFFEKFIGPEQPSHPQSKHPPKP